MEKELSPAEQLKKELFYSPEHSYKKMSAADISAADSFCDGYKDFLDTAKTEREAVNEAVKLAEANGFKCFNPQKYYPSGSKIYYINRNKALILAVTGKYDISKGVNISAAHIDSPRLDLKPNPMYEDSGLALFKTHYYGGIKKYQWTTILLSLHGVVVKKNGETVNVCIGEKDSEPKFIISDLLPHLSAEQNKSSLADGIKGEGLNIIIGSRPFDKSDCSEQIKLNILNLLYKKYGITEADFLSAELEAVPALKACDIGFDRSLIGAYGHDDRVCAYPALMAILDTDEPLRTAVCVLTDKEETGSEGNTGLCSSYLEYFISDLAKLSDTDAGTVLSASSCLSADVNAAFDPTYSDVYEKRNSSYINMGVCVTKYTGARGKSGTSDASAEYVAKIRAMLDNAGVCWQTGELGKVDAGGGGTVAKYIANLNVDVVDVGVPVLSMHAPCEVVSKLDVYNAYLAFLEFNKNS